MGGYVLCRENDLHDSQADEAEISASEMVSMTPELGVCAGDDKWSAGE